MQNYFNPQYQLNLQQQQQYLQQQLDMIKQQQQQFQQFQQPAIQPQFQQPTAPNVQQLIQAEVNRQLSQNPHFQAQFQAQAQSQEMSMLGRNLLTAVGTGLNESEQQWFSKNINRLPEFFASAEGKEVTALAINSYRKFLGVENG